MAHLEPGTVNIELQGEISLDDFAKGVGHFHDLLGRLAEEVGEGARVEWIVEDLETGSAMTLVRGVCDRPGVVDQIIKAYGQIGQAMQNNQQSGFSQPVATAVNALRKLIDHRVTGLRLGTPDGHYVVSTENAQELLVPPVRCSRGSVTGTVQTLSNRGQTRFILYDNHFDRGVKCYVSADQEQQMLQAWGKRAIVEGEVGRDPVYGRPVFVRKIRSIRVVTPPPPGSYKEAAGILKGLFTEPVEVAIRRARDAE